MWKIHSYKNGKKKREHTLKYKCIINVNIQLYLLFYIKYIRSNSLTHKIYWFRKLRTWLLFCRDMQTFLTLRLFSFPQQATRDHVYVGQVFFQQKTTFPVSPAIPTAERSCELQIRHVHTKPWCPGRLVEVAKQNRFVLNLLNIHKRTQKIC